MKKLLALSIALLSLNLYGAELNFSDNGLEGWGKKEGVDISVEDYSKLDKTFDVKAIENQVELKLRLAGIKINEDSDDYINIDMQSILTKEGLTGYHLTIMAKRRMTFKYNGKEHVAVLSSNHRYASVSPINYRESLDGHLTRLLITYLKANPKPKEKKSLKEP